MFFKKKKTMNDQSLDKESITNEHADNMAQHNESEEEQLAGEQHTDDSLPGNEHLNEQLAEESELDKLNAELSEAKEKYLRLVAEFENFRKRNAKERVELIQTAGKETIQSLLVVLDDTDRAAKQLETSEDINTIKEGISLVFNKLRNILQQKGLKKMDSIKQEFDADLHEAVTEIPVPDENMKGKVIDEIEPGYYLNDKLIRHAKVVVGK